MSDRHPHDPIITSVRKAVSATIESGLPGACVMLPAADLHIVLRNLDAAREGYEQAAAVHQHKCAEFVHLRQKYEDLEARCERLREDVKTAWHAERDQKQRAEKAEAELKALSEQEPVAVFKGSHDGRFVIDWLHGYIPPVNLALYTAPVPPAAAPPADDERAAAVERTAALAGRVAGEQTANTIRHNRVVMRENGCCIHCMRLD